MFKALRAALAALLFATLLPAAAGAAATAPEDVIAHYHTAILAAMRDADKLGIKGRFDLLKPVITEDFNLPVMARATVGAYWDSMTEAQRTGLVEAFSEFSVANFANRFDDYSGERFETLNQKETSRGDIQVNTAIIKSDGDKVLINYLMRKDGDRWRVIDVFLTGAISELATRRSEYTSVIQHNGVDSLLAAIKNKTQELLQK
ncbi:MAG: ABC transporter substrate-binding protein [Alphaproteobacteria bacterium]